MVSYVLVLKGAEVGMIAVSKSKERFVQVMPRPWASALWFMNGRVSSIAG